jgi:hypothetical protein
MFVIFPGITGELHDLPNLLHSVVDHPTMVIVTYPNLTSSTNKLLSFDYIVSSALRSIGENHTIYKLIILGYSFGANVAAEFSVYAKAAGWDIQLVILLDPALPSTEFNLHSDAPAISVFRSGNTVPAVQYRIRLLRSAIFLFSFLLSERSGRRVRRRIAYELRISLRRKWNPPILNCSVVHIMSQQLAPAVQSEWSSLCSCIEQHVIPTRHSRVVSSENFVTIRSILRRKLISFSC